MDRPDEETSFEIPGLPEAVSWLPRLVCPALRREAEGLIGVARDR